MQIVIDIPEKLTCEGFERPFTEEEKNILIKSIGNGTLLPKGHGDLIDRKNLIENGINKGFCDWYDEIKMADIIIKADKAERENKE